jgi:hypothetical protein
MTARWIRRVSSAAAHVALLAAICLLGAAPALSAGSSPPTLLDPSGQAVSAYGGWAAWSRYDAATRQFALVLRTPAGEVVLPPLPERQTPFDVELGPDGPSVAAVYSRCANAVALTGCRISELTLSTTHAVERVLAVPGGGSLHGPAIWQARLGFLRRNPSGGSEDSAHPTARRPDDLFVWRRGSSAVERVSLPSSRGERGAGWPRGLTGVIGGLTLNGRQLAYTTATGIKTSGFELSMFTLWYQLLGQGPRLIDQATAGEANVCVPSLRSPTISGEWLYAYLHACDPSGSNLDRWTRYGLRARTAQSARGQFVGSSESAIGSIVPDGGGIDWDSEGVRRLDHVSWRAIARPTPDSFCTRNDLFC